MRNNSKGVMITIFVDSDEEVAQVLETLNRPLCAFVLEGRNVHLSLMDDNDANED